MAHEALKDRCPDDATQKYSYACKRLPNPSLHHFLGCIQVTMSSFVATDTGITDLGSIFIVQSQFDDYSKLTARTFRTSNDNEISLNPGGQSS